MKHRLIASAIALAATSAIAADEGLFVYGAIGQAKTDRLAQGNAVLVNSGVTSFTSSGDEADTGYKLQAGYRFNRHFAVEGGYVDLGKFHYNAAATVPNATRAVNLKSDGWNAGLIGSVPVSESFSVFGKVGVLAYKMTNHCDGTGIPCSNTERVKNGTSTYYGVGADWNFTRNWFARAEYEVFQKVGDDFSFTGTTGTSRADIHLAGVGVGYRF